MPSIILPSIDHAEIDYAGTRTWTSHDAARPLHGHARANRIMCDSVGDPVRTAPWPELLLRRLKKDQLEVTLFTAPSARRASVSPSPPLSPIAPIAIPFTMIGTPPPAGRTLGRLAIMVLPA